MATATPFTQTAGNDKANLALSLASAILFDGKAAFSVRRSCLLPTSRSPVIARATVSTCPHARTRRSYDDYYTPVFLIMPLRFN